MGRREIGDVRLDLGEPHARVDRPLRDKSVRHAALIEHLNGAGVQTAGARTVEILTGAAFDDDDADTGQLQLGRQHQPGRAASCDHHCVLSHGVMISTFGLLAASPHPRGTVATTTSVWRASFEHDPRECMRVVQAVDFVSDSPAFQEL